MNYQRLYDQFVVDRRLNEGALLVAGGYTERHHIVPRSLGGGDETTNLIALTPEDHFFAHLLLAKIHGGAMWAPVAFMVGGSRKDYKPTLSRIAHGWASRAMANSLKGAGAYQFDTQSRTLVHSDGRVWSGLQSEMPTALSISKSLANMLIKGRVSVARGWALLGAGRKGRPSGKNHGMHKPAILELAHVDGRTFTGTQFEFSESMGVSRPAACKIATGECAVWNGWHLKGATLPTMGRGAKWSRIQAAATT